MVKMYNKYKDKGINFIIVTDEQELERIERAKEILKKNNVKWTNYFDINKDFSNKVGLPAYPTQFLVDQNGRIVIRVEGDLDSIRKTIDNYLMSQKNE